MSRRLKLTPDPRVLDSHGRVKPHAFEPPHDDPGPGPCWYCLRPEGAKIHRTTPHHPKERT